MWKAILGIYAIPFLNFLPAKYRSQSKNYPSALAAFQRGLATIPLGVHLQDEDMHLIVSTIQKQWKMEMKIIPEAPDHMAMVILTMDFKLLGKNVVIEKGVLVFHP